jgi:hypothetical protein
MSEAEVLRPESWGRVARQQLLRDFVARVRARWGDEEAARAEQRAQPASSMQLDTALRRLVYAEGFEEALVADFKLPVEVLNAEQMIHHAIAGGVRKDCVLLRFVRQGPLHEDRGTLHAEVPWLGYLPHPGAAEDLWTSGFLLIACRDGEQASKLFQIGRVRHVVRKLFDPEGRQRAGR